MNTIIRFALFSAVICCTPSAHAGSITFGSGANEFAIDFVAIGNPGNPADTTGNPNPAGSVNYTFWMGTYAVSRDMVTKANTEGNLGITMHSMNFVTGGARDDMPATGVSWNQAARFVNWLNVSQGFAPAYKFEFQPGDGGYGSNQDIQLWESSDSGFNADNPFRNTQAHYFLPSVDEWYKAAYYDPNANDGAGGYWNFATGSNSVPTAVASGTDPGTAVYGQTFGQGPADITLAGGLSPYGTMGQGGNTWEWEETTFFMNNFTFGPRGVRGGSWGDSDSVLSSSTRASFSPSNDADFIGFRVAMIPEPSTLLLAMLTSVGLLLRRR